MFKYKRILLLVGAGFLTTSCYSDFFGRRIIKEDLNLNYYTQYLNETHSKVYFYQNYGINNNDYDKLNRKEVFDSADLSLDPNSRFDFILFDLNYSQMELTSADLNKIYELLENNRLVFVFFINGGNYNFLKDTKFYMSPNSSKYSLGFNTFESKYVTSIYYTYNTNNDFENFYFYHVFSVFTYSISRLDQPY